MVPLSLLVRAIVGHSQLMFLPGHGGEVFEPLMALGCPACRESTRTPYLQTFAFDRGGRL